MRYFSRAAGLTYRVARRRIFDTEGARNAFRSSGRTVNAAAPSLEPPRFPGDGGRRFGGRRHGIGKPRGNRAARRRLGEHRIARIAFRPALALVR